MTFAPCRSCSTLITFAATRNSQVAGPFEVDPDGDWTIEDGVAVHLGKAAPQLELGSAPRTRYTSHFARCKEAAKWRRRR